MRRNRHEGGLYQKNGYLTDRRTGERRPYTYYQAAREVPAEYLPPGTSRKRITGSGRSAVEARRRLDANYAAWMAKQTGEPQVGPPKRLRGVKTVGEYFTEWLALRQYDGLSNVMRKKYAQHYRDHIGPYLGTTALTALTAVQIRFLLGDTLLHTRELPPLKPGGKVRTIRPLGASARKNVYRTLSVMLNAAVADGLIPRSPLLSVKAPEVLQADEDVVELSAQAVALISEMQAAEDPNYCRFLLQYLGLRQSERLGLTWSKVSDLDGEVPMLLVSQQLARHERIEDDDPRGYYIKPFTKTKSNRKIVIPEPFLTALREHRVRWLRWQEQWEKDVAQWEAEQPDSPRPGPLEHLSDLVFLQPNGAVTTPKKDTADWHAALSAHGLPYWRGHLNRHITATILANQEPAVPESTVRSILGHKTEAMTLYYAQLDARKQQGPMSDYGQTFATHAKGEPAKVKSWSAKRPN